MERRQVGMNKFLHKYLGFGFGSLLGWRGTSLCFWSLTELEASGLLSSSFLLLDSEIQSLSSLSDSLEVSELSSPLLSPSGVTGFTEKEGR